MIVWRNEGRGDGIRKNRLEKAEKGNDSNIECGPRIEHISK